jgi:hypothetical protein
MENQKPPQYLNVAGAHGFLSELGFKVSVRQVRRLFDEGGLPVFSMRGARAQRRERYISRQVLEDHFNSLQEKAIQKKA